jgi:hypothetical protein
LQGARSTQEKRRIENCHYHRRRTLSHCSLIQVASIKTDITAHRIRGLAMTAIPYRKSLQHCSKKTVFAPKRLFRERCMNGGRGIVSTNRDLRSDGSTHPNDFGSRERCVEPPCHWYFSNYEMVLLGTL